MSKFMHDFGKKLVTYALINKGFSVDESENEIDIVAMLDDRKLAFFVLARRYKTGSDETRGQVFKFGDIERFEEIAERENLKPVIAHVVCDAEEKVIHLFMLKLSDIKMNLDQVKHGYRLRFSKKYLDDTISLPFVDYSHWGNEKIGDSLFG